MPAGFLYQNSASSGDQGDLLCCMFVDLVVPSCRSFNHHGTQNTILILFISLLEALFVHYSINTPNLDQTIAMFVEGRGGEGVQCCRLLGNKSVLCHLIFVPANHENKHNMYEVKKLDVLTF